MYMAALQNAEPDADSGDALPGYQPLPGGQFDVAGGAASVSIRRLGVFYACSRLPYGLDAAAARCVVPTLPAPGAELRAVSRDWVPGQVPLTDPAPDIVDSKHESLIIIDGRFPRSGLPAPPAPR